MISTSVDFADAVIANYRRMGQPRRYSSECGAGEDKSPGFQKGNTCAGEGGAGESESPIINAPGLSEVQRQEIREEYLSDTTQEAILKDIHEAVNEKGADEAADWFESEYEDKALGALSAKAAIALHEMSSAIGLPVSVSDWEDHLFKDENNEWWQDYKANEIDPWDYHDEDSFDSEGYAEEFANSLDEAQERWSEYETIKQHFRDWFESHLAKFSARSFADAVVENYHRIAGGERPQKYYRKYLKPGQKPPAGAEVQTSKRGKKFVEVTPGGKGKKAEAKAKTASGKPQHPWMATKEQFFNNIADYEYLPQKPERSSSEIQNNLSRLESEFERRYSPYWRSVVAAKGKHKGQFKPNAQRDLHLESESHEMGDEIRNLKGEQMAASNYERRLSTLQNRHRFWVEGAVREGKPVPAEVLKDYPDLAAKAKPAKQSKPKQKTKPPDFTPQSFQVSLKQALMDAGLWKGEDTERKPEWGTVKRGRKMRNVPLGKGAGTLKKINKLVTATSDDLPRGVGGSAEDVANHVDSLVAKLPVRDQVALARHMSRKAVRSGKEARQAIRQRVSEDRADYIDHFKGVARGKGKPDEDALTAQRQKLREDATFDALKNAFRQSTRFQLAGAPTRYSQPDRYALVSKYGIGGAFGKLWGE